MKVNEENRDKIIKKLSPLTERISRQYGLILDLKSDFKHLQSVIEHYDSKRNLMLTTQGELEGRKNPDFTKALMISETVRLFLREIAPRRIRRKSK